MAKFDEVKYFFSYRNRLDSSIIIDSFEIIFIAIFIVDIIQLAQFLHAGLNLPRIPRKFLLGLAVPHDLHHRIKGTVELGGIFGVAGIGRLLDAASGQQQEHRRQQSNQFFHLELSVSCLFLYSTILMA